MGVNLAIQKAVYELLIADATLATLLAPSDIEGSPTRPAVYDFAPQAAASEDDSKFPYVTIGEDTAAEFDTDDIDGQETTLTLHAWSRQRGRKEVKQILDALYAALHDAALTVEGSHALFCYWEFSEALPVDDDGITQHGVTRFRIVTQQS